MRGYALCMSIPPSRRWNIVFRRGGYDYTKNWFSALNSRVKSNATRVLINRLNLYITVFRAELVRILRYCLRSAYTSWTCVRKAQRVKFLIKDAVLLEHLIVHKLNSQDIEL